jgi:hypothetical protein
MKLKHILENKILVPRRSKEERAKNLAVVQYRQIQEYIKNGSKGDLDLNKTSLKTLPPNLIRVGGRLDLEDSQITSLGNLEYVGGKLDLESTPITSLGNLKYVGNSLWLRNTPITSLDNLEYVGGNLYVGNTPIAKTHTEEQIRKQVNIEGLIPWY